MLNFLRFFMILFLFISIKIIISKIVGKRFRKYIFNSIEVRNNVGRLRENKNLTKSIIIFSLAFLIALLNGYNVIFSLSIGGCAIGFIYAIKAIKQSFFKKQILNDLLNVSECLRVQISSQIPLGSALRNLPEICINKELSVLLTNIYLEYELSKFMILDSANALQSRFNYSEIRIFISALNQQIQGTSAIEAFDNLITILREKYIEYLEDATKSKMAIMTMGVFIIVINIAALGIYPVAVETFNAINVMLK